MISQVCVYVYVFPYMLTHHAILVREKVMYNFATYYVSSYCNDLFLELASHVHSIILEDFPLLFVNLPCRMVHAKCCDLVILQPESIYLLFNSDA